jgi:hypothetical protein
VREAKQQGALPTDYDVTYEEMKVAFEGGGFKLVLKNNAHISLELQLSITSCPCSSRVAGICCVHPKGPAASSLQIASKGQKYFSADLGLFYAEWKAKRKRGERAFEVAVDYAVPDAAKFATRVVRLKASAALAVLFEA